MSEQPIIKAEEAAVISLADSTRYADNGIVSRTVLQTANVRQILFGFAEGEELTEHTSSQHAIIQMLSGECDFKVSGISHQLKPGDLLSMPPHAPHAVKATTRFSMLLTLIKP